MTKIEVDDAVSSGISMRAIGDDLVPLYEEHETRLEYGIGLEHWGTMDYMEKAMIVAVRRNRNAVKNLQSEAETKAAKRKARR